MIEIQNLTKVYEKRGLLPFSKVKERKVAVEKLNLTVPTGKIYGLLGVNGAGKTSLAKMLSTLIVPTSGTAIVGGMDIVKEAKPLRKRINMIAGGERALYWRLTGRENLAYFAKMYNVNPAQEKQRIEELLERVGLTENANQRVEEYSKGMKQRLQIARGLINDPEYLFMDEPTIGLDAPIAREIREFIKHKMPEKTILFTSHYMEEVEELCDEVAILHQGKMITQGSPQEIKKKYTKGFTAVARISAAEEQKIASWKNAFSQQDSVRIEQKEGENGIQFWVYSEKEVLSAIAQTLGESGLKLLELQNVEKKLEDVLVEITKKGEA